MKNIIIPGLVGLCLGISACTTPLDPSSVSKPESRDISNRLEDKIKSNNIELRGEFTSEELTDIKGVIDSYMAKVGDLNKYDVSIGKFERDNSPQTIIGQSEPSSPSYEPCEEFRGYYVRGNLDPQTLEISIAPKEAIDAKFKYEQKNGLIPKGEEGKIHDFKWVLNHELGHLLLHKTGMQQRLEVGFHNMDDAFYKSWYELQLETSEKCKPLKQDSKGKWENIRPEGYPSHYSYFSNSGEQIAELITYSVLECDYAKNDSVLTKKIEFIDSWLKSLR